MTVEVKVPPLGESISSATIARITKKVGDFVKADEVIAELETDKVALEVSSPSAGRIAQISLKEGDEVTVGQVIALIEEGKFDSASSTQTESKSESKPVEQNSSAQSSQKSLNSDVLAPSVKRIVGENNLDASQISGTGKDGRITKSDALSAIDNKSSKPAQQASSGSKPVERVRMSKLRQTIAARLKESQNTAAILTTFNEVDMTNVMALRNQYKDLFEKKHESKLGFMSFFVKAAIEALKEIPALNAEISGDEIIYKNFYDIGVAVGSPQGLVVPVLREADQLSFSGVEKEIANLGAKARDGKLAISDLTGATFTISNGGVYGSLMSTPIINPPQSGILGMHKIQERPMVINGEIKVRQMMYLALSYDHRIVDGKEAVTFLVRIKDLIEDPRRLILSL